MEEAASDSVRLPSIVAHNKPNRSMVRIGGSSKSGELKTVSSKSSISKNNKNRSYSYVVFPGNNSRALINEFRKRPWWHSGRENAPLDLSWEQYKNKKQFKEVSFRKTLVNHLYANQCLVTKKGLYRTISRYCSEHGLDPLTIIPRTFYLEAEASEGLEDDIDSFMAYNSLHNSTPEGGSEPIWILKPAAQTNRGIGIKVARGAEAALEIVRGRTTSSQGGKEATASRKRAIAVGWIVQEYMERPLLVSGRKFDIRCYVLLMLDKQHGLRAYYYRDGYVRTSSKEYSLKNLSDRETHLTNDAVQTKSKNYGQFEEGNKLSYTSWQEVINREYPSAPLNAVQDHILPKLLDIIKFSVTAASETLLAGLNGHIEKSFEVLGYDFMVHEHDFCPTLIEINSNPCLEYVSPMLENIISSMLSGVFVTAVDPYFPPPKQSNRSKLSQSAVDAVNIQDNHFSLIYPVG